MQTLALAENVAADAVANQAWVVLSATPFLPGRQVTGSIFFSGNYAAAGTVKIQSSPDQAAITDQLVANAVVGRDGNVTLDVNMRAACTVAGTAGSKYSAYLYAAAS